MNTAVEMNRPGPSLQITYRKEIPVFLEKSFYISDSDLAVWISIDPSGRAYVMEKKGIFYTCESVCSQSEWMEFILDCREPLIINSNDTPLFPELFLHKKMKSILVSPFIRDNLLTDVLILNSIRSDHYGQRVYSAVEKYTVECMALIDQNHEEKDYAQHTVS